tara:strand:- start:206 stop:415 length:210 start_codon:yes stop_codon:yes gene_type:complete
MAEVDYKKYIKSNGKLNYQLLYEDLADITGFWHDVRRKSYYEAVTEWYKEYTSNDRDRSKNIKSVDHAE